MFDIAQGVSNAQMIELGKKSVRNFYYLNLTNKIMNRQNIPQSNTFIQSSKYIWITIIAVALTAIIVSSGVYVWQRSSWRVTEQSLQQQINNLQNQIKNFPKPMQSTIDIPKETQRTIRLTNETAKWKTYSSSKYGFKFKYPPDYIITSISTEDKIILARLESGHWLLSISVESNPANLTLSEIVTREIADTAKIQNITIDGKAAIRYSITNFGDYGNVGAIVISGNNIIRIYGDGSSSTNKRYFELLLSTFRFSS